MRLHLTHTHPPTPPHPPTHPHHPMQAALFHSIKPLFANKPVLIVCNKTDVVALDEVPGERAHGGGGLW